MRIAIVGPGAIGSTFAFQLARAGHDVTVVARAARLAALERERAIVVCDATGAEVARAAVDVRAELDPAVAWDLVLVTVLATQVDAVLPALTASAGRKIMFMFNTFESIEPLRAAVGGDRFVFGFPGGVFTLLIDGRIHPQIRRGTTVGEAAWAEVFSAAGVPTVVEPDMQSWLRTHAAMVAPLMAVGVLVHARGSGIAWAEARAHARALDAGMAIVRAMGNALVPSSVARLAGLPTALLTVMLWALSRTKMLRDLGALGATEPRMLVDMMRDAQPDLAGPLVAIRP